MTARQERGLGRGSTPGDHGRRLHHAERAFAEVEHVIATGPIPGAAAAVGDAEGVALATFGVLENGGASVSPDTWYDLASLTKVMCTVPLCLDLVEDGRLDPDAPLREYLPEAGGPGNATVLELATHTSGLPAWAPLYSLGLAGPELMARVLQTPLTDTRGTIVYSDFGYILLGHLVERLTGERLAELASRRYHRLDLGWGLGFNPPRGAVAPTEQGPWRNRLLRGEVHDDNASALGGVAGHAGLFGTLRGVAGFAQALLEGRIHSPVLVEYISREHARAAPPGDGERRGIGWVLAFPGWSGGDLASQRTIGHTGFTGTGLWIDLERGRYSVLLTNRVYRSRITDPEAIVRLRRTFNNAAHGS